jgi:hypothetical protein
MYYVLIDSTGNLIESYSDEGVAMAELARIVKEDPVSADDVAMLKYGIDGLPVGDAVQLSDSASPMTLPGFGRN